MRITAYACIGQYIYNEIIDIVMNNNEYHEGENESDEDQERKNSHAAGKDV